MRGRRGLRRPRKRVAPQSETSGPMREGRWSSVDNGPDEDFLYYVNQIKKEIIMAIREMTIKEVENLTVADIRAMKIHEIDGLYSGLCCMKNDIEANDPHETELIAHLNELIPVAKSQLRLLVVGW